MPSLYTAGSYNEEYSAKIRYCRNYYSLFFCCIITMRNSISSFYIIYSLRCQTVVSGFISSQEMDSVIIDDNM